MVWSVFDDWYSVPFVKNSQKSVSQNSKNHHWCTNRHMSTQSPPNTQSRANSATLRKLHHMCLGSGHSPSPVGRADCMCLHGRSCVWLPFAAACCFTLFYLLMMPAARLVCQRPSSNFPYFRTPLANFLLSHPNSVEYGNSKTTTLLPSAKCTRPLFQGRTGCSGRPSGWHDIVTCQRLVVLKITLLHSVSVITNFVIPKRDKQTDIQENITIFRLQPARYPRSPPYSAR